MYFAFTVVWTTVVHTAYVFGNGNMNVADHVLAHHNPLNYGIWILAFFFPFAKLDI